MIEITIDLYSNRLTLALSTSMIQKHYLGECMTGFDLPTNYVDNPEALFKRTKAKLRKVLALESEDNHIR